MSPERDPSRRAPDPNVLGAVLCGGASRRMGSDKALLRVGGRRLIQTALDALDPVCGRVVLASGSDDRHDELGRESVLDRVEGVGPLAGLDAALAAARAGGEALVVTLACDLPNVTHEVGRALVERLTARGADACLLTTAGGDEPLVAAYSTRCAPAVADAIARGERRMDSFHAGLAIERLDAGELGDPACAHNVNTPDDLALARGGDE